MPLRKVKEPRDPKLLPYPRYTNLLGTQAITSILSDAGVTKFNKDVYKAVRSYLDRLLISIIEFANVERVASHDGSTLQTTHILRAICKLYGFDLVREFAKRSSNGTVFGLMKWLTSFGLPHYADQVYAQCFVLLTLFTDYCSGTVQS